MKRIVRAAGIVPIAMSVMVGLGCGGGDDAADASVVYDARPQTGTLSVMWSIEDTGGQSLTCMDVGNTVSVRITATPTVGGPAQVDAFSCTAGSGTSRPIDAGNYQVTIELRVSGTNLAPAQIVTDVDVTVGNDTALTPVVFTVDPTGNFKFRVDTQASGPNCESPPTGGGLSEISIEFRDSGGTCVPTTFDISAGAGQPAGTYTTTCPAGAPFSVATGCGVENDQDLTVNNVSSGSHSMIITGTKGTETCWRRTTQFTVPGNGLTADLGTQLLALDAVPGCDPNAPDAGVTPDAGATTDAAASDAMP